MSELLSVIIPSYNEEKMIPKTAKTISEILDKENIPFELVFVDDGSSDRTWESISTEAEKDERIRGISFSRNFGKDPAIFAGLGDARGDCAAVIDCDLQHPPEKLVDMYRLWQEGYEVVEGVKQSRGKEPLLHSLCAKCFYSLMAGASEIDMRRASDYKLLGRNAINAILAFKEKVAFFRVLSYWIGFKRTQVPFEVKERTEGRSKWSVKSLFKYAVRNVTSFSKAPLKAAWYLGLVSLLCAIFGLILSLGFGVDARLFFSAASLVSLALTMMCISVLGYYVYKIYLESADRPKFIIAKYCGKRNVKK